ncbi:MAG: hypothetical protein M3P39_10060 [Actinomycetota bacterium]|jgi:hypothetical protein|nr:hypothetical protein [Actinomycetota bacterium]
MKVDTALAVQALATPGTPRDTLLALRFGGLPPQPGASAASGAQVSLSAAARRLLVNAEA